MIVVSMYSTSGLLAFVLSMKFLLGSEAAEFFGHITKVI